MKILQLCAVDFTLYHFLMPLIRGLGNAGHEVVAACADGPLAAQVRDEGIHVEAIPFSRGLLRPRDHLTAYWSLRALLRREAFDIVHVHTPVAALIGRLAARHERVPRVVYTAHGFYFHDRMPAWKRAAYVALEWFGGRCTDVLFTQAEEDAATARRLRLCRTGVIEAIGNGVDISLFRPSTNPAERIQVRARHDTPANAVVVVMIGRLVAEKGYRELLDAMCHVDAHLWVIGDRLTTEHAQNIDDAIDRARDDPDLGSRLHMLGYRTDIEMLLRAADIFTLPSHREGMPRSIIEAMMTALPVVATNVRGSREEVAHEETGFLVPIDDTKALAAALGILARDPALRKNFGTAGLHRARELYDENIVIDRQLRLLGLTPS